MDNQMNPESRYSIENYLSQTFGPIPTTGPTYDTREREPLTLSQQVSRLERDAQQFRDANMRIRLEREETRRANVDLRNALDHAKKENDRLCSLDISVDLQTALNLAKDAHAQAVVQNEDLYKRMKHLAQKNTDLTDTVQHLTEERNKLKNERGSARAERLNAGLRAQIASLTENLALMREYTDVRNRHIVDLEAKIRNHREERYPQSVVVTKEAYEELMKMQQENAALKVRLKRINNLAG